MASAKISVTKNYRLFARHSNENRPLDLKKHRRLHHSMKLYGFLKEFPVVCCRDAKGNLIVKDGQHRLAIAEELGLPVYWIEASQEWDVAVVNSTAKPWVIRDYAEKFAANGVHSYVEGLEFADQYHLTVAHAFTLLSGQSCFNNCQRTFIDGSFRIKDRKWANDVAGVYCPMIDLSRALRGSRFLEACMACCRIESFDAKRLIASAERCREKLVSYSSRDAFLQMMEEVYNFGRSKLVGLRSLAIMAMRERNPVQKSKKETANEAA